MTKPIPGRLVGSPQPAGRRPYRWLRAAALAAGALALAACGTTTPTNAAQTGASTPSSSPVTTTPSTSAPVTSTVVQPPASNPPPPTSSAPPVQATGQPVPPNQVNYAAASENTPQTVWEQDGGRTLVLMAEEGGCVKVDARVPKQTADEVDVVLLSVAETHRVCPLYVRNIPVAAHLDAPLGARKLVVSTQTGTQH
jgi:hypothetical protein